MRRRLSAASRRIAAMAGAVAICLATAATVVLPPPVDRAMGERTVAGALASIETEGEKLYNEKADFDTTLAGLLDSDGAGQEDSGAGESDGATGGAAGPACDCSCGARPDAPDATGACAVQCLPAWAACEAAEASEPPEPPEKAAPKPPKPTIEAQRKWFTRLVNRQNLPPEVSRMLVDDFVTMSDETRAYLIRRYRDVVR